jgi:hypothetical protein
MVKTTYNISSVELLTDIHRHRINNKCRRFPYLVLSPVLDSIYLNQIPNKRSKCAKMVLDLLWSYQVAIRCSLLFYYVYMFAIKPRYIDKSKVFDFISH